MTTINPEECLILVVDDNSVNLRFITMVLERGGYQVLTAQSGVKALEMLKEHSPDLEDV
ncbi:MAG: response regulator [Prochlorothrix sp.]|nr:response regulator [Prochlorothrix sp.]